MVGDLKAGRGTRRRMMPGGVGDIDESIENNDPGIRRQQGNGNEEAETRESGGEGELAEEKDRGEDYGGYGRTRSRRTKLKEDEHIPAVATTVLSPGDARKYIAELTNSKDVKLSEINPTTIAKVIEKVLRTKEAYGNKRLIDTVTATTYILREMGRDEWSGGKKKIDAENSNSEERKITYTYKEGEAQTDVEGKGQREEEKEDEERQTVTNEEENNDGIETAEVEENLTFADELRREVRQAVKGVMKETQCQMRHLIKELDKRIDYMYTEQKNIKEAHEIGIARAKANFRMIERKCELTETQLLATLGIVEDTNKKLERMGWYAEGIEKKQEAQTKGKGKEKEPEEQGTRKEDNGKTIGGKQKERRYEEIDGNKPGNTKGKEREGNVELGERKEEWGGWEDIIELSPSTLELSLRPTQENKSRTSPSPSPSPPLPNQEQQRIRQIEK